MPGLMWLDSPRYQSVPFCLTFVRGATGREMFVAFGVDPADVTPTGSPGEASPPGESLLVRIAPSGDRLVALEENIPPQGVRPEVLRRLPAGSDAVAVYQDIGKLNHEFVHAVGGQVVSGVVTTAPPHWHGSDPQRLAAAIQELKGDTSPAAVGDPPDMRTLLTVAERVFGLSLDEEALGQSWPGGRILPGLSDLPPRPADETEVWIGDPVIDARLAHAAGQELEQVARLRLNRLMTSAGLDQYPALTAAFGSGQRVSDDDPAGRVLRKLARAREQADMDLAVRRDHLTVPEEELRARIRRGQAAFALRFALAGRYRQALANELTLARSWDPERWRDQALADLEAIDMPPHDLRAAERAWESERHLPDPRGVTDTGPVRRHIQKLLDSGMDITEIAARSGSTPVGIELLLSGRQAQMNGHRARKMLTIKIPGD